MVVIYLINDNVALTVRGTTETAYREVLRLVDQGYTVVGKDRYEQKRHELLSKKAKKTKRT